MPPGDGLGMPRPESKKGSRAAPPKRGTRRVWLPPLCPLPGPELTEYGVAQAATFQYPDRFPYQRMQMISEINAKLRNW